MLSDSLVAFFAERVSQVGSPPAVMHSSRSIDSSCSPDPGGRDGLGIADNESPGTLTSTLPTPIKSTTISTTTDTNTLTETLFLALRCLFFVTAFDKMQCLRVMKLGECTSSMKQDDEGIDMDRIQKNDNVTSTITDKIGKAANANDKLGSALVRGISHIIWSRGRVQQHQPSLSSSSSSSPLPSTTAQSSPTMPMERRLSNSDGRTVHPSVSSEMVLADALKLAFNVLHHLDKDFTSMDMRM
jgi:hypothetical protein